MRLQRLGAAVGAALSQAPRMLMQAAALAVALLAGAAMAADRPQNTPREIVGQSYDQIIERGWMLFAVYEDFAPYSWEEAGKPRGVDVELARIIAQELGVEPRFRFVGSDETVDDDLRNNVWKGHYIGGRVANVMMHVPYNREFAIRNEQVVITGHYMNEKVAIAYREDAWEDPPVPAAFRYGPVGVENDSIADFYLSSLANGVLMPNIRRYPTPEAAMAALAAGEVTGVVGARAQLEHGARMHEREGLRVHEPPLPGLAIGQWTLGVAVRHTWRQLGYAVDDAVQAAVRDGRLAAIFADHGLEWSPADW